MPAHKNASFSQPRHRSVWNTHTQCRRSQRPCSPLRWTVLTGGKRKRHLSGTADYPQYQASQSKKKNLGPFFLALEDICSPPFFFIFLRELPQYPGSWDGSCMWEGLAAGGDADPDLKRSGATWEKARRGKNKSSSVRLWRLVWLMALFGWLCIRMFPSHYPCCMKSKKHKRDRKVGRGVFCKAKTISQRWFKPLLITYSKKSPTTASPLHR